MSSQNQEWQVERIIQRANDKGIIKYKVLWKGFPPSEATWEPIEHLEHCKEAIYEFENNLKKLQGHKGSKQKDTEPVGLHDAGQEKENGSQSKPKQQEERISVNQEEEPRIASENNQEVPEKEEEVPAEPQAQNADEAAKEVIVKQEAECAGKPQTPLEDEALNTKKREFEPSQCEVVPSAGKPGKKKKKVEVEVKNEFINPTTIEGNSPPKTTVGNQSQKRNQSFDPNAFKKPEKAAKPPSDPKESETKSSQEKKSRIFKRQFSRYAYCDKEFQAQQKTTLSNIMRKIAGQERVKSKPTFIDISKTSDLLDVFEGLHQVNCEIPLSTLDLLVRVDYGWAAIGRSEGRYVIADVNLINEQSWQVFVNFLKKKEQKEQGV